MLPRGSVALPAMRVPTWYASEHPLGVEMQAEMSVARSRL
jgi:hypothetical protein